MNKTTLALVALLGSGTGALAAQYDGKWSVLVVTEQGSCDVYRWEVAVNNGRITPIGDVVVNANGGIDKQGRVRIAFTRGADQVSATGTMQGDNGRGRWSAAARQCAGRWQAEKRG